MAVITKEELATKYKTMKNTDLAKELDISIPTLLRLIDDAGIERKGSGNPANKTQIKVI